MSLASNLTSAFTRVATEFRAIRTLISGTATGDISGLNTTNKTSLVAAINEAAGAGGASSLDQLSDVTITGGADGHILRRNGAGQYVNVLGTDHFQPLDTDLTSIAALTTTAFGRGLLTLADSAALTGQVAAASETVQGKVELATNAESVTGTDTTRAVTPANVAAVFTDRIDTAVALGSSNTKVPSQAAVKAYADGLLDANNAYQFRGGIDCSTNPNYPAASAGHTYRVTVEGRIGGASGPKVEVNDTLTCLVDATAAGNHATVGANWLITQSNIDGAVVGPASSTSGNIASFSGTTGKVIADSGFSVDNDSALAANSATRIPTQGAVKAYAQPLDGDLTALAGLTSAADRLPYFSGAGAASLAVFTAFGRSLVDDADDTAGRTTLDVFSKTEVGDVNTDFVAAFNAALTAP